MVSIRGIQREDAEKYRALCNTLDRESIFRLYEPDERPSGIESYIEEIDRFLDSPNSEIFVIEKDGEFIGYLQAIGRTQNRVRHVVSINIAILREYTGKGLGARLFAALEDWARERGIRRLDLSVMENNPNAIKLYEKRGFRREGTKRRSMRVDGSYVSEISMAKWLDDAAFSDIAQTMDEKKGALFTEGLCAVRRAGEEVFYHAVGCAYDSVFDLASVSKMLTGTMILRLIGEGKFALDAPIGGLLTNIGGKEEVDRCLKDITVRDLLIHASGLPAWHPFYATRLFFFMTLEDILKENPDREKKTEYSDINFMLLGEIIRHESGKSLQYNLASLNGALGTDFTYIPANPKRCVPTEYGNRVEMRMVEERGMTYRDWRDTDQRIQGEANDGNCYYFWQGLAGHAGVFGSAEDILRLGELYLRGGEGIIPKWLVDESLRDQGGGRGLAWDLSDVFPHGAGHTGFTGTAFWICPEKDAVAALLCSRLAIDGPPNLQPFRREVFTKLYETL